MFHESVLSQARQSKRRGNSEQMKQHGLPGPKGDKGEAGLPGDHGRPGTTGHKVTSDMHQRISSEDVSPGGTRP